MKASGLLLLLFLGLLTIWAELPPASGQTVTLGECPKPPDVGICVHMCESDDFCGPGERCCSTGCGRVCTKVVKASLGECPKPIGDGACVEMCENDDSCGPGERCCSNGCGHVCTKVVKGSG
uniref:Nigwaprin-a-like n=1 Tax=Pogona vitticeps TaxID=103695 RepID=A0ABM5G4W2_9SAUR